jgi:hypothetical protein
MFGKDWSFVSEKRLANFGTSGGRGRNGLEASGVARLRADFEACLLLLHGNQEVSENVTCNIDRQPHCVRGSPTSSGGRADMSINVGE